MTTATPDSPKPTLTTPPDEMVEGLKSSLVLLDTLIAFDPTYESPEARKENSGSADFMRGLFTHLDDLTLAAFCAYVATNLTAANVQLGMSPDLLRTAIVFAENAKVLAWSLGTPEAPDPS